MYLLDHDRVKKSKFRFYLAMRKLPKLFLTKHYNLEDNLNKKIFSRNSLKYDVMPLEIGTHKYFGKEIEIASIQSATNGLCYKLKFSDPLPYYPTPLQLIISSSLTQGVDKLEKVHILVASNNTWQGIVGNRWPYSKFVR